MGYEWGYSGIELTSYFLGVFTVVFFKHFPVGRSTKPGESKLGGFGFQRVSPGGFYGL